MLRIYVVIIFTIKMPQALAAIIPLNHEGTESVKQFRKFSKMILFIDNKTHAYSVGIL